MSLTSAKLDLLELDVTVGRGRDIVVEVSKALTIADGNSGVEAKVICKTSRQILDAYMILEGKHARSLGIKWNEKEELYELPNGSAIRVTVERKP